MYCGSVEFVCLPSMVGHVPVLLDECMDYLDPGKGGNFADLTFGGGGHSRAILEANEANTLLAFDCDPDAGTRRRKSRISRSFPIQRPEFSGNGQSFLSDEFDGVLMDLGISSFQLMEPNKGFSFRLDAPIDMGWIRGSGKADFLRVLEGKPCSGVREYGGEPGTGRNAIIEARGSGVARTMSGRKSFQGR